MFYCTQEVWNGLTKRVSRDNEVELKKALKEVEQYRKLAIMQGAKEISSHILYQIIQHDEMLDIVTTVSYFKNTFLSDEELIELTRKMPYAEFGVIHASYHKKLCKKLAEEEKSKRIKPLTLREANAFVKANHRHHDSVTGCKFAIGLVKTVDNQEKLIGAAICGRPVSRHLDNGVTLKINRLCTIEGGNACSMLYGACSRIARDMGYKKVITYILESESGISLKASNFILEKELCGGIKWSGQRKNTHDKLPPAEMKQLWAKKLYNT